MLVDEVEVYISPSGLSRAAIVRRPDGFFWIYKHVKLPPNYLPEHFANSVAPTWFDDSTPLEDLYKDKEPSSGIFGTVEDARRHLRSMPNFSDAVLARSNESPE
jgi:hypothetical protein